MVTPMIRALAIESEFTLPSHVVPARTDLGKVMSIEIAEDLSSRLQDHGAHSEPISGFVWGFSAELASLIHDRGRENISAFCIFL